MWGCLTPVSTFVSFTCSSAVIQYESGNSSAPGLHILIIGELKLRADLLNVSSGILSDNIGPRPLLRCWKSPSVCFWRAQVFYNNGIIICTAVEYSLFAATLQSHVLKGGLYRMRLLMVHPPTPLRSQWHRQMPKAELWELLESEWELFGK